jgi:hypothetical protein
MSEFHAFTLSAKGLLRAIVTEVRISGPFDPSAPPRPTPTLMGFQAIWDTGATNSMISQRVVDRCGMGPIGLTDVHTPNGMCTCEVYVINIFLPSGVGFPNVGVTKGDLGPNDVLIGMDLINKGDFAITHERGDTVFSFRYLSLGTIDFQKT